MAEPIKIGPLLLDVEAERATITLAEPSVVALEIPDSYESQLRNRLADLLEKNIRFEMDLEQLPAISSRQLGLMLTIHKVIRDRQPTLRLRGVSDTVRHVLGMTRTQQFFELES